VFVVLFFLEVNMSIFEKILVWIGVIADPNLRNIEVVSTNIGGILLETSIVRMVPRDISNLNDKALQHGWEGPENYDAINRFFQEKDRTLVWDSWDGWQIL